MSTDSTQLITILVPTYNRLERLKKLVGWLESDAFHNPEVSILISNNASRDGTRDYLEGYAHIPNLTINQMPANCGADIHIGWLYAQVKTKFLWMICDDDLPEPGVLKDILSFLKANLEISWVQLPHRFFGDENMLIYSSRKPETSIILDNGAEFFPQYAFEGALISSNILDAKTLQSYLPSSNPGNAFFPLWLMMQVGNGRRSAVLSSYLLNACTDISWTESRTKILTNDLIKAVSSVSNLPINCKLQILYGYYATDPIYFTYVPFAAPGAALWLFRAAPVKFVSTYILACGRRYHRSLSEKQKKVIYPLKRILARFLLNKRN